MSDERTPSTPTPSWGEEAQGLASRFAIASGVAITFVLFGLIIVLTLGQRWILRDRSDRLVRQHHLLGRLRHRRLSAKIAPPIGVAPGGAK